MSTDEYMNYLHSLENVSNEELDAFRDILNETQKKVFPIGNIRAHKNSIKNNFEANKLLQESATVAKLYPIKVEPQESVLHVKVKLRNVDMWLIDY